MYLCLEILCNKEYSKCTMYVTTLKKEKEEGEEVYITLNTVYCYYFELRGNLKLHIANTSEMHSTRNSEWVRRKTARGSKGNGEKLR